MGRDSSPQLKLKALASKHMLSYAGSVPRSGDATRSRLLGAAADAFVRDPVATVSLRAITAAAGAGNTAAVHQHFGTRAGLEAALVTQALPALTRAREVAATTAAPALDPSAPPDRVGRLRTLVAAVVAPVATLLDAPYGPAVLRLAAGALTDPPTVTPAWLPVVTGESDPTTVRLLGEIEALAAQPPPVWALHRRRLLDAPVIELSRRARAEVAPRAGARQPVVAALIDALAAPLVMPPSDALVRATGLAPTRGPRVRVESADREPESTGLADRLREATQGIRRPRRPGRHLERPGERG